MAIIKQFDKRSGITYVYESKSSARALSVLLRPLFQNSVQLGTGIFVTSSQRFSRTH